MSYLLQQCCVMTCPRAATVIISRLPYCSEHGRAEEQIIEGHKPKAVQEVLP